MLENKLNMLSSFRDQAGFVFQYQGNLYRQINDSYQTIYQKLMTSGLYHQLEKAQLLISHEEVDPSRVPHDEGASVIQPERIPFISYPYEWCFSQLKDAALLTLNIQKIALEYGMTLKDASNYNVQFLRGKPIFIDTLSFEPYEPGKPWQAYRQFCQHFLAPLMLMSYRDIRLNQLLKIYIDGIPLDLASGLLPTLTKFKLAPALHIHLHAKLQKKYQGIKTVKSKHNAFSLNTQIKLMEGLTHAVQNHTWKIKEDSQWYDYYHKNNNYSQLALNEKKNLIDRWTQQIKPTILWDLGANTGKFSQIASKYCKNVISFDVDTSCVEHFYLHNKNHPTCLPLVLDLTNPSPGIGWGHQERNSFMERGPADAILALGLIHHLAIVNNLPLDYIASFFSTLTTYLIIEFVPKEDPQVQKLLSTRKDIFPTYDKHHFEKVFFKYFELIDSQSVVDSLRTVYLLKAHK